LNPPVAVTMMVVARTTTKPVTVTHADTTSGPGKMLVP
jgi:hypothetical protein